MKINVVSAIAVFAFAIPGLASAQAPVGKSAPAMTIRYNDLDLHSAQGAQEMLHRIRKVAVEYCHPGETGFEATARFEACYQKTVDQAVAKLNAPRVTEALNTAAGARKLARLP
jgi:UrcA family protein